MHSASSTDVRRARRLRTNLTDAEQCLWMRLRANQMPGYRFRRQVPIGPYVVDFACFKARLLIELDGSQHGKALEHDQRRTAWLASQNFRVLRFWDNDVLTQTEGVLEAIRTALAST